MPSYQIYDCIVFYDDGKLSEDKFRKGISVRLKVRYYM